MHDFTVWQRTAECEYVGCCLPLFDCNQNDTMTCKADTLPTNVITSCTSGLCDVMRQGKI